MSDFLSKVYASLDKVVLTRQEDGLFRVRSAIPDWFVYHAGASVEGDYDILESFPYLSCFIDDAEKHWQSLDSNVLCSGPWVEPGMLEEDEDVAFEAEVMFINGFNVLILQRLGEKFQNEVRQLQHIRDGLLTQEILESEVHRRTLQIRQREEEIALKLISLTSYRDEETGSHVRRIGLYAANIARGLGWGEGKVDEIRIAAPMHDIGKIGIPDRILLKAGALNDDEFSVMKRHTIIGAEMLTGTGIPVLEMAADIALHHHERWDGTGYPRGLKGEAIPITARITAIVDIYDALVHKRVYKEAMPENEALLIMKEMSGKHLDPELLQIFMYLLPTMRRIREEIAEENELDDVVIN